MKKYYYFFRLRFSEGVQYRMATVTALTTQLIWGLMECLAYKAIGEASQGNLPMNYSSLVTYIWLKEAFLALFNVWTADNDLFGSIVDGGIAYEICRPVSVYSMWFARSTGARISEGFLRCIPVLVCAFLMPEPYKMTTPISGIAFMQFIITSFLALGITVAFCMFVYMLCFFTISPQGWRMVLTGAVDFLSGNIIPLPFFPKKYLMLLELSPFTYMQNVPFRIYSGDLSGREIYMSMMKQCFWLLVLIIFGYIAWKQAEKRIVIQGG